MNQRPRSPIALCVALCLGLLGFGLLGWGMPAVETAASPFAMPPADKILVVLGDSLSAGFGVDPSEAWPARIQEKIREAGLPWKLVNAGLSGDTSAGGLRRLDWILRRPVDALLLELGSNDGLRGLPLDATRTNLQAVIDRTRAKYPNVRIVLAGMKMPENLGEAYTRQFESLYGDLAQSHQAALIPFLLEGVGGRPELNLPDQIHPNAEGHRRVATNVWKVLQPVLQAR
jgi:acyl-CoA thioesterase-1